MVQCPHCKTEISSDRGLSIHLTRWCKARGSVTTILEERRERQCTPTPVGHERLGHYMGDEDGGVEEPEVSCIAVIQYLSSTDSTP
jgi:chorismate-pyruvate lyase